MKLIGVFVTGAALIGGVVAGPVIALVLCRRIPGFAIGMWLGVLLTIACSVLMGYVVGAYGESILGTRIGVPLGIFIGATIGSLIVSMSSGFVGAMFVRW